MNIAHSHRMWFCTVHTLCALVLSVFSAAGDSSVNTVVSKKRLGLIVSLLCFASTPLSLGDKKPSALGQKVQVLLMHSHCLCSPSPSSLLSLPKIPLSFFWVYSLNVWLSITVFTLVLVLQYRFSELDVGRLRSFELAIIYSSFCNNNLLSHFKELHLVVCVDYHAKAHLKYLNNFNCSVLFDITLKYIWNALNSDCKLQICDYKLHAIEMTLKYNLVYCKMLVITFRRQNVTTFQRQ